MGDMTLKADVRRLAAAAAVREDQAIEASGLPAGWVRRAEPYLAELRRLNDRLIAQAVNTSAVVDTIAAYLRRPDVEPDAECGRQLDDALAEFEPPGLRYVRLGRCLLHWARREVDEEESERERQELWPHVNKASWGAANAAFGAREEARRSRNPCRYGSQAPEGYQVMMWFFGLPGAVSQYTEHQDPLDRSGRRVIRPRPDPLAAGPNLPLPLMPK
jgi:hypothetical protein